MDRITSTAVRSKIGMDRGSESYLLVKADRYLKNRLNDIAITIPIIRWTRERGDLRYMPSDLT